MGKGDKKTKRGKIIIGSYGVRRPRKDNASTVAKTEQKSEKK
jgi:30S ribosomal protein S31